VNFQPEVGSSLLGRRKSLLENSGQRQQQKHRNSIISSSENEVAAANVIRQEFNAFEYAKFLNRVAISDMISYKLSEIPLIERWIKVVDGKNLNEIKIFKEKTKSLLKLRELVSLMLVWL
jgi:hypothetical protein